MKKTNEHAYIINWIVVTVLKTRTEYENEYEFFAHAEIWADHIFRLINHINLTNSNSPKRP